MFDVEKCVKAKTIDEFIEKLYAEAYDVREVCYPNREEKIGIIMQLPKLKREAFNDLHPFFKMFYVAEKKSKKIFPGKIARSDREAYIQEARALLYATLKEMCCGVYNNKLEFFLQVHSMFSLYTISRNETLSNKFVGYILECVDLKLRKLSQSTENPDFSYNWRVGYNEMDYIYLDDENNNIDISDENYQNENGELTKYIYDCVFPKLTKKQKQFVENALKYNIIDSVIKDLEGNLLYSNKDVYNMKQLIKKKFAEIVENDPNIEFQNGRYILKK